MNLPNKLTMVRVLIIPLIVIIYYLKFFDFVLFLNITFDNFLMCVLFVIASVTDFFDGYLARKYDLVTTFGKFVDPLADKLLVMTALLILMADNIIPMFIVLIILSREFIVTGIRLLAVEQGKIISASKLGKYKTATTMICLIVLFFNQNIICLFYGTILLYIALFLTIFSGLDYFLKNRKIIVESI